MNDTYFANYLRDKNTWELIATVYADFVMDVMDMLNHIGWRVQDADFPSSSEAAPGECYDETLNPTGVFYDDLEVYTEERDD